MSLYKLHPRDGYNLSRKPQLYAFAIIAAFCFIHLTLLALGIGAAYRSGWLLPYTICCFAFIAFSIWLWRPVVGKVPTSCVPIEANNYPEIVALVGEICAELGTPMPEILMTSEFTAGYARLGFWQKPTLLLGHSLLSVLNRKELVTVLSHELAHEIDGARTRTLFVTTSQVAMQRLNAAGDACVCLLRASWIGIPIASLASKVIGFWQMMAEQLERDISADYRNAEFVADYNSLAISGHFDATSLFQKLAEGMLKPVQTAYKQAHSAEKTATIRQALRNLSDHQRQDIWTRVLAVEPPPNSRHPHLLQRIAYLKQFQHVQPRIVVDGARFGRIQAELSQ